MGILDGLMGQIEGQAAGAIAAKMGIDPQMAQMAISALTQAHPQPGDTVQAAAAQTGMPADMLSSIMGHLGGEGGLGALIGQMSGAPAAPAQAAVPAAAGAGGIMGTVTGMLDRDGDGNPLNDLAGIAGGLFGGKK